MLGITPPTGRLEAGAVRFKLPGALRAAESKETPFNFPGRISFEKSQHLGWSQWRSHLCQGMGRATIAL